MKRTAKKLLTTALAVIGMSCMIGGGAMFASADTVNDDYYVTPTAPKSFQGFEDLALGVTSQECGVLYLGSNDMVIIDNEADVISGTKSLKKELTTTGETMLISAKPTAGIAKGGSYAISIKFRLKNISQLYFSMITDWGNHNNINGLCYEWGIQNCQYDDDGNLTSADWRPGWLYDWSTGKYMFDNSSSTKEIADGVVTMYFEVTVPSSAVLDTVGFEPKVIAYEGGGSVVIDDFTVIDKTKKDNSYYTYQYNQDFETIADANVLPNTVTPFWATEGVTFGFNTEVNGHKTVKYEGTDLAEGEYNKKLGGITVAGEGRPVGSTALDYLPGYNLHYEITYKNTFGTSLMTLSSTDDAGGIYYAEIYFSSKSVSGAARNMTCTQSGDYVTMTFDYTTKRDGADGDTHYALWAKGTGALEIDSIKISYEDAAPATSAKSTDISVKAISDVSFNVDFKEETFETLKYVEGNEKLDLASSAYTLENGVLTLRASNFQANTIKTYNYELTTTGGTTNFAVNVVKAKITAISGVTAQNKVYDGSSSATLNFSAAVLTGVASDDNVTVTANGMFENKNVGENKAVIIGTYTLDGEDADLYIIANDAQISAVTGNITKKSITVTADDKEITAGDEEAALTYTVTGLVTGDTLTGALTREAGDKAGEYKITIGTLSAGDNYTVEFTGATYKIIAKGCSGEVASVSAILSVIVVLGAVVMICKRRNLSNNSENK